MNDFASIDRLRDAVVFDANGDKVGKVEQVYLDATSSEPTFVTVRTGFFGMKETFVPLANARWSADGLTVPHEKSFIKDAPNIDADGPIDHSEERRIWDHYGLDYSGPDATGRDTPLDSPADRSGPGGHVGTTGASDRERSDRARLRRHKYPDQDSASRDETLLDRDATGRAVDGGADRRDL